ncbi:MAG: DUF4384 domain-containing protein [Deltaproteobacteria bacterium]|nr:DUF4384 domain-containing protein [Deltaproteobacteria bacterium]MBW1977685.1 DUF4384 domain-containing protein [Deltaproteobacteria bacterium]MBW2299481.1 DUF4384 domain-containing protein [Deltaproteobacteria bacterium]RLB28058.1 MAG: hypothetical protein DRH11_17770 [Deltaproteobacteria bacterium]
MKPLRVRHSFFLSTFFLLLPFLVALTMPFRFSAKAGENGASGVSFKWAFAALVESRNGRRLVSIRRDTVLKTGDQLKIFIQLQKKCFVYLLYQSPHGEVKLLFPYNLKQFEKDDFVSHKYFVPQGDKWFVLDKSCGLETFYLLASATRLEKLENVIRLRKSNSAKNEEEAGEKIINEIKTIIRQNKKLTATPERPEQIGANVRGVERKGVGLRLSDLETISRIISAPDFYCRTFTIDHR